MVFKTQIDEKTSNPPSPPSKSQIRCIVCCNIFCSCKAIISYCTIIGCIILWILGTLQVHKVGLFFFDPEPMPQAIGFGLVAAMFYGFALMTLGFIIFIIVIGIKWFIRKWKRQEKKVTKALQV